MLPSCSLVMPLPSPSIVIPHRQAVNVKKSKGSKSPSLVSEVSPEKEGQPCRSKKPKPKEREKALDPNAT